MAVDVYDDVYLNGTLSYDVDGTIVSYDWDFGDGYTDTGMFTSHSYNMTGNYTVTLTVTDNDGATDIDTNIVTVTGAPSNIPPIAYIFPDYPLMVNVNDDVYLNGTLSYDVDGTIVSYDWEFGDGYTDTGQFTSHSYNMTGNYTVTLTVTDDDGATDMDTNIVTVTGAPSPDPYMIITKSAPALANPGEMIAYTLTYQNVGNGTAYNVMIFDNYSFATTFVNSSPAPDIGDNIWFIGDVPSGSGGVISISMLIDPVASGVITNIVYLDYENGVGTPQPQEFDTADTVITAPEMVITKTAPVTASPEETISYSIFYENVGTDWAYDVVITDVYPPEVTFVSAVPAPDIPTDIWSIGSIAPGGSGSIMITVQISTNISGNITNLATLDYEDSIGNPMPTEEDYAITYIMELNQLPVAHFTFQVARPVTGYVDFDASSSYDLDGIIVDYYWDFGDGTNGTGITCNHTYIDRGKYTVTLIVTDNNGETGIFMDIVGIPRVPSILDLVTVNRN